MFGRKGNNVVCRRRKNVERPCGLVGRGGRQGAGQGQGIGQGAGQGQGIGRQQNDVQRPIGGQYNAQRPLDGRGKDKGRGLGKIDGKCRYEK